MIEITTDQTSRKHIDEKALRQHLIRTAKDSLQEDYLYLLYQAGCDWIKDYEIANTISGDNESATIPVCKYFLKGRCKFNERCHNFHPGSQAAVQRATAEKSSHQPQTTEEDTMKITKKPPMRTATNVISRIQWDPELSESDFVIGYSDRFIGIVEKQFSEFNWEDIATVGIDVLAIPKHRIQYFKYKDKIVWDRRVQLDNFFGSRGNGTTIHSLLKKDIADATTQSSCVA